MVTMTFVIVRKNVEMEGDRGDLINFTQSFEEAEEMADEAFERMKQGYRNDDLYFEVLTA